jgi:hypothetical protein
MKIKKYCWKSNILKMIIFGIFLSAIQLCTLPKKLIEYTTVTSMKVNGSGNSTDVRESNCCSHRNKINHWCGTMYFFLNILRIKILVDMKHNLNIEVETFVTLCFHIVWQSYEHVNKYIWWNNDTKSSNNIELFDLINSASHWKNVPFAFIIKLKWKYVMSVRIVSITFSVIY